MSLNPKIYADSPVFAGFTFDASGSMHPYAGAVVQGHTLMLDTLRRSQKCEMGVLYVYQTLFASSVRNLNPWYPLDPGGNDSVVQLTSSSYTPGGMTALYDAVYSLLRDVAVELNQVRQAGLRPSARVAVITDGGENDSAMCRQHGPTGAEQMIQEEIRKLRDREWLESSLVIGLVNDDFTPDMLEKTRKDLGFGQAVPLSRTPRDIRRAFRLASTPNPDRR